MPFFMHFVVKIVKFLGAGARKNQGVVTLPGVADNLSGCHPSKPSSKPAYVLKAVNFV